MNTEKDSKTNPAHPDNYINPLETGYFETGKHDFSKISSEKLKAEYSNGAENTGSIHLVTPANPTKLDGVTKPKSAAKPKQQSSSVDADEKPSLDELMSKMRARLNKKNICKKD